VLPVPGRIDGVALWWCAQIVVSARADIVVSLN